MPKKARPRQRRTRHCPRNTVTAAAPPASAEAGEWPAALAGLPICPVRKLPVPFSAERGEGGRAVFTALDPEHKELIIRHRLCGVCGQPLGYWFVFLGDETSTEPGGFYVDPPMHEDCAVAAIKVCPFIQQERVPRRPATPEDVMIAPPGSFEGPKRPWVMAVIRDFKMVPQLAWGGSGITLVFRPARIVRTRRFEYQDGRLTEVTPSAPGTALQPAQPAALAEHRPLPRA
jgi:hypothetical protein